MVYEIIKAPIPTTRELIKSIPNFRMEWRSKTPMGKWCYFYGFGRAVYKLIHIPIMNDVNYVRWTSYWIFVTSLVVASLSAYTVLYYVLKGQPEVGLPSTCMAFICIGVSK